MQAHGCIACASAPTEVAHTRNGGTGRKADAKHTVALCHAHHAELHRVGVQTFEATHAVMLSGRTLEEWAASFDAAWSRWCGLTPIADVVPRVLHTLLGGDE